MSPENVLEARGVTKRFGDVTAVDGVNFTVKPGRLVGLVGPNGAGKTTTIRMILGLLTPDAGEVLRFGRKVDVREPEGLSRLGYTPDVPVFPEWMRPLEFLCYIGGFFSSDRAAVRKRASEMMAEFGLERLARRKVENLSRGERQRLGMAQAVMGEPELLVLDEPTSGLDPLGRYELITYIERMKERSTVIVSTHLLEDVERICDHVLMIDRGRKIIDAPLGELKAAYGADRFVLQVEGGGDELARSLGAEPWVKSVSAEGNVLDITVTEPARAGRAVPALLAEKGIGLAGFERRELSLEEIYIRVAGDVGGSAGGAGGSTVSDERAAGGTGDTEVGNERAAGGAEGD